MRETSEPGLSFHPAARRVVRFGPFRSDLSDGSLWRGDEEVRMPPRALGVLLYLLERPGRVVAKSDLIDAVWKDANVSETSLTEALGIVRQTLGDNSQNPEFIQTVHRRGYRFIASISVDGPTVGPRPVAVTDESETAVAAPSAITSVVRRPRLALLAFAAIAIIAVAVAAVWSRGSTLRRPVTRATITLPSEQASPYALSLYPIVAISPDGQEMVYAASTGPANQLFLRRMDQYAARPLPGTTGAHGPFFSPDGKRVAFFAERKLKHVPISGGEPVTVTDARGGIGGTWTTHGTIIFAPDWSGGLLEVDANGGTPQVMAASPGGGYGYRWPRILDDGETVLATRWRADQPTATVVAVSRTRGTETVLIKGATAASYLSAGQLVVGRNGVLYAASYRPGGPVGAEREVLDGVMTSFTGAVQYSVSNDGSLVYVPDDPARNDRALQVVDSSGAVHPLTHEPRAFQEMSVCEDRLAVSIGGKGSTDIWIGRISGGALTQLTRTGSAMDPAWRPGCVELAYSSGNELYLRRGDGEESARRLLQTNVVHAPFSWSPDGKQLVYVEVNPETRADIWVLDLTTQRTEALVKTAAVEWVPRLSPNGRWLAYQSHETGRPEIYLSRFRSSGGRTQVSTSSGTEPSWSPDGRTLYFMRNIDGQASIVATPIDPDQGTASTETRVVLKRPGMVMLHPLPAGGFVIADRIREHLPITTMNLIVNWGAEIAR